jgi:hypothetical protein
MAVWSLTPFFNELDILEIRLATLDDVVDYHVIGESPVTHSGKPKPLYFAENASRFERWKDKIIHRVIEMPTGLDDWGREKRQRRCLWYGFKGKPEDCILLSDVDEIPHPDAVKAGGDHILLCNMHVAKLNWRWKASAHESWTISRMFPAHFIGTHYKDLEEARLTHTEPLGPPGWHLSWMNDPQLKLDSFVHQELVPHADIAGAQEGEPLFPGVVQQEIEWTDELPPYVLANKERFQHMMVDKP